MSPEPYVLFFDSLNLVTFETFAWLSLFIATVAFFLSPGGLAWACTKSRVSIPGPSGSLAVFSRSNPHRVLAALSQRFKASHLMAFSVGFSRFVISSEPDTAKEILNSSAFADRPVKESAYELLFHRAMGFAPYGEYWRNLRRIASTHLFSPRRIAGFEGVRVGIGMKMVKKIKSVAMSSAGGEVEVKKVIHFGSLNNVMTTVFGESYDFDEVNGDGCFLERLVSEGYELLGIFNWSDHFGVLRWFDFQGVRKRCRALVSEVNTFVGSIIEKHKMKARNNLNGEENDFVDVLLGLQKDEKLSDSDMIAVLWVSSFTSNLF